MTKQLSRWLAFSHGLSPTSFHQRWSIIALYQLHIWFVPRFITYIDHAIYSSRWISKKNRLSRETRPLSPSVLGGPTTRWEEDGEGKHWKQTNGVLACFLGLLNTCLNRLVCARFGVAVGLTPSQDPRPTPITSSTPQLTISGTILLFILC